jgi:bifunctional NMN adenylyltransferase/nudix hydrolase
MKKYETIVLIGRFQPVHSAHVSLLQRAAELASQVIIIIGSDKQPRTYKNPFTSAERELQIRSVIHQYIPTEVVTRIERNIDTIYNDTAWAARVQAIVSKHTATQTKIAIIGHTKDESSYYLKMFPQWEQEECPLFQPLSATDVRDLYFRRGNNLEFLRNVVPESTFLQLRAFQISPAFEQIIREREFIEKHNKQYAGLMYPPIFMTVDAVVVQSGHVLMIKRRAEPGKGLWAMPGGYVNAFGDKSLEDAMLRELDEETGIKVPEKVLRGNIRWSKLFDAIGRSPRGRIITNAYKIVLPDGPLPKVKGADDSEKAKWVPIGELKSEDCFEDHYEIIMNMIGA